jgi:hypothetical protein
VKLSCVLISDLIFVPGYVPASGSNRYAPLPAEG